MKLDIPDKDLTFKDDGGNILTGTTNVDFQKMRNDLNKIKWAVIILSIVFAFVFLYSLYRIETGDIITNAIDRIANACVC